MLKQRNKRIFFRIMQAATHLKCARGIIDSDTGDITFNQKRRTPPPPIRIYFNRGITRIAVHGTLTEGVAAFVDGMLKGGRHV